MDTQLHLIDIPASDGSVTGDPASDTSTPGPKRDGGGDGGTRQPARTSRAFRLSEEVRRTGRQGVASAREALASARRHHADDERSTAA